MSDLFWTRHRTRGSTGRTAKPPDFYRPSPVITKQRRVRPRKIMRIKIEPVKIDLQFTAGAVRALHDHMLNLAKEAEAEFTFHAAFAALMETVFPIEEEEPFMDLNETDE